MPRQPRDVESWFWSQVDRSGGPRACWPWTGAIVDPKRGHNGTYGRCYAWGRQTTAHRVALALHLCRDIDPRFHVLHSCNNPPCCNPAHLREGTPKDNAFDAKMHRLERVALVRNEPWEWTVGNQRAEQTPGSLVAAELEREVSNLPHCDPRREGALALADWNRAGRPSQEEVPRRRRKGARHG